MEISELKTPFYLFDENECVYRAQKIKNEIATWGGKLCFAIKANPFLIPSLLPIIDKFEVCSPGELEICRKYHVPGEKILFSGVVKTKENIMAALQYPVDVVTLESIQHWTLLKECMDEMCMGVEPSTKVKIMPRLSNGAQFGLEESQLLQIIEEGRTLRNVKVEGIHYFTGTQKKGNKYEKELDRASRLINRLMEEYGLSDIILEYGPGFAVPYFVGDDFTSPFVLIEQMKQHLLEKNFSFRIDIELGRYIAASCGKYFTRIVDIKKAEERNYCLVDGGIHHVNYYGSNMAMRTPVVSHLRKDEEWETLLEEKKGTAKEYMICGSLCTFADILVRGLMLNAPHIGDVLIFDNIGAYSVTEGSYLFLSRELPGIYLKKQDGWIEELRNQMASYEINSAG